MSWIRGILSGISGTADALSRGSEAVTLVAKDVQNAIADSRIVASASRPLENAISLEERCVSDCLEFARRQLELIVWKAESPERARLYDESLKRMHEVFLTMPAAPDQPVLVSPDLIPFSFAGREDLIEAARARRNEALKLRRSSISLLLRRVEGNQALSKAFWERMRSTQPALFEGVLRISRS